MPSQRGHMPPRRVKVAFSVLVLPAPRSMVIAPLAFTEGTLNEYALGEPMCGFPSRLNRMRSMALASVAVPTVERGLEIIRCDSAAIVANTSELLPEPETPVNTVSRRFGISMLMSLRLFSRAPCTRIRSWLSATCSAGDCVSVLVAMLIVPPCDAERGSGGRHSSVVKQLGDVAIGVGDGGHQAAATGVVCGLLHGAVCAGHGCDRRTAQRNSWMRTMLPAGSRTAQSRTPYGCSVGSWTTSASLACSRAKAPSRSAVARTMAVPGWSAGPTVIQRIPSYPTSLRTSKPRVSR